MDATTFAPRLKELREQKGLSQKALADKAGVSQNAVSHWEQGTREPSWSNILALAAALGVDCTAFTAPPADRGPAGRGRPKKATGEAAADQVQAPAPPPAGQKKPRRKK